MEGGYPRLAELQEEVLWLCEAAHLEVIWATEVLDNLARIGRPSVRRSPTLRWRNRRSASC